MNRMMRITLIGMKQRYKALLLGTMIYTLSFNALRLLESLLNNEPFVLLLDIRMYSFLMLVVVGLVYPISQFRLANQFGLTRQQTFFSEILLTLTDTGLLILLNIVSGFVAGVHSFSMITMEIPVFEFEGYHWWRSQFILYGLLLVIHVWENCIGLWLNKYSMKVALFFYGVVSMFLGGLIVVIGKLMEDDYISENFFTNIASLVQVNLPLILTILLVTTIPLQYYLTLRHQSRSWMGR